MYNFIGESLITQSLANEKVVQKRELTQFDTSRISLSALGNRYRKFVQRLQLQRVPENVQDVACRQLPQFC